MVGTASGGLRTSSLTSLVPRQVMLESCAVVAAAAGGGDKVAEKRSKKRRRKGEQEEKRSSPVAKAPLLRAIASFLESGGFTRTLAALWSEAQLEIDDGSEAPVVDLEEIICNYLQSSNFSKDAVAGNITGPEEQYAQNKAPMEEEGIRDHSEEPISKKKKANGGDHNVKTGSVKSACDNGMAECHLESKDQKRKKSKKSSKETIKYVGNENLLTMVEEKPENLILLPENVSSMLDESNIRSKEKRKKNKVATDSPCGVDSQDGLKTSQEEKGKSKESGRKTDSQMPTIATENATSENPMREDNLKSKDKKKRNHNLIVERSSGCGVEVQNGIKMDGGKKGKSVGDDVEADAKGSNPNIENIPSSPKTVNIDKKAKKRKRSAAEETELHVDNAAAVQESKQDLKEGKNKAETQKLDDSLLNSELHASGKKKKSESEGNSEKSANTPANKESKVPWDANGTLAINGSLGNNEQEGNRPLKSKKAELKHSAEPNAVNAFQRVKIDQVKFADERLHDNSYWAKGGAESGYGSKAQEILGQVRGRDFRHEKTKKKRGSYRGGQIDFQSHSVKFKYSDDEE